MEDKSKFTQAIEAGGFKVHTNIAGQIVLTYPLGMGNVGFHYPSETELAIIEDMISRDKLVPTEFVHYFIEIQQELLRYEYTADDK